MTTIRSALAGLLGLLLVAGVLGLVAPTAARADSAPLDPAHPATPPTVTADALPTVQIDGVAWSQVVVGSTVYVAGKFTSARPAGSPAGTQQTPRNNLLAYDIRTGALLTSFAPSLNAQALVVTASPDGARIYVGGDFTQADGQPRNRIAAYSTATGALVADFRPGVSGQVRAIAATNSTVYLGGSITALGGVSRSRLAAVSAATGALLPWAPVPGVGPTAGNRLPLTDAAGKLIPGTLDTARNAQTTNEVLALVVTGGGTQVVASGRFYTLNGVQATGVGALDAVTGATRPFAVNQLITNQGINSAVYSLATDGSTVYGTGYDFYGPGNLEGGFAAAADGGAVTWMNACSGDTYGSFPMGGALYLATHAHNCAPIGGFPEQSPRVNKFATAVSLAATGTVGSGTVRNTNFVDQPAPTLLPWFPTMNAGTFTGQGQSGWSVTGTTQYLAYGGEFLRVNGADQQGLVRYAVPALAPNRVAPSFPGLTPTVVSLAPGSARVSWRASSDPDNEHLTYRVYRDGNTTTPVFELRQASTWWNAPMLAVTETGLAAGPHRYRVVVTDPGGNRVPSSWTTAEIAAGGSTPRPYADTVRADGARQYWPLGESAGAVAYDHAGGTDLTVNAGATPGQAGGLAADPDTAYRFDGSTAGFLVTPTPAPAPATFTLEAWFQTTSTTGGRIVGFGNRGTGTSTTTDRQVVLDAEGRVVFGVFADEVRTLTGPTGSNDGRWHHVVASLGAGGMALHLDGVQVATRPEVTSARGYSGFWRIGGDRTGTGGDYLAGAIDEVAIYPTVLSAGQVANHHSLGSTGEPINLAPTASFTAAVTDLSVAVDGLGSADSDGTLAGYSWDFGDGASGTGAMASHDYTAAGSYPVTLTVTDDDGATAEQTRSVTVVEPRPNLAPVAAFGSSVTDLTASFDGSASADADGSIASYGWDFGDGSTGSGVATSHAYAAAGSYPVLLTVTDNQGGTGQQSGTVTVTAPAGPAALASDTFGRSVTGGLGTADVGGPWTASYGAARQSVTPGVATLNLAAPGNLTGSYLAAVSQTSVDVSATVALSVAPSGGGTSVYLTGRRVGVNQEYRARVRFLADGSVRVAMTRLSASATETLIGAEVVVAGLRYVPGTALRVRVSVTGTGATDLAATVWPAAAAEPAVPTVTRTDSTPALQAPGAVGVAAYLSGSATTPVAVTLTGVTAVPGR